jgi:multicomponent Na+:H+ antiporter subunit D
MTHSESESPVSALLSGVVVKTGVFPLVRCAFWMEELLPVVQFFGVGAALLGVTFAMFEKDTKRVLALSTVSQMGWILVAPAVGGLYALAHGLVKATTFLIAGVLPSRDFNELRQKPMPTALWIVLVMACLSISGLPLFAGFGAKMLTLKQLDSWHRIGMNIGAIGTAILYAKFIFLPHARQADSNKLQSNFWMAMILLVGGLIVGNVWFVETYTVANMVKAIAIIGAGWLVYSLTVKRSGYKLPPVLEQLEHLIGGMSLVLILLFWMVVWA